ncbi:hypothetical protein EVAR_41971_1 [Eumeta japonica]|uniref:Uncharacterized protein n=1 Tax=Eumeta variegata TaxID=151549 RepID=A0A4C1WRH4_EUMVA|nr:hypothetical protein EVAR_41971_1 [Eumeta japonica]
MQLMRRYSITRDVIDSKKTHRRAKSDHDESFLRYFGTVSLANNMLSGAVCEVFRLLYVLSAAALPAFDCTPSGAGGGGGGPRGGVNRNLWQKTSPIAGLFAVRCYLRGI